MSTAVISVYKVANFPDGGGHFWVYMQYVQALLRLGCEVYWLEQPKPERDPPRGDVLLAMFFERMKRVGLEGKTRLYTRERAPGGTGSRHVLGSTSARAGGGLQRRDAL